MCNPIYTYKMDIPFHSTDQYIPASYTERDNTTMNLLSDHIYFDMIYNNTCNLYIAGLLYIQVMYCIYNGIELLYNIILISNLVILF